MSLGINKKEDFYKEHFYLVFGIFVYMYINRDSIEYEYC